MSDGESTPSSVMNMGWVPPDVTERSKVYMR